MRLLLDSHVVLWGAHEPHRLSAEALVMIKRAESLISLASHWEIAVKRSKGKLPSDERLADWLAWAEVDVLPITLDHVAAVATLPQHHRDPFDRMLVAQAIVEGLTIVTADHKFDRYDVPLIRA